MVDIKTITYHILYGFNKFQGSTYLFGSIGNMIMAIIPNFMAENISSLVTALDHFFISVLTDNINVVAIESVAAMT